jgi:inner membrane protein
VDPLTQGVFGAIAAHAIARRADVRAATVAGALGGMAADLDVLIRSDTDPLLFLDFHRHFTHALAFIPIGGALVGLALWPLLRRHLTLARTILFAVVGYATHGLLDACTSYGTRLWWPFSDARVAWNTVAVVDPFVTLPLLLLVVLAVLRRSPTTGRVAVVVALALLGVGRLQRGRADHLLEDVAREHGHVVTRGSAKPSLLNMVVWRGTWEAGGQLHTAALRPGLLDVDRVSTVRSAPRFVLARDLPGLPADSVAARDVARFAQFSDGWLMRVDDDDARALAGAGPGEVVIGDFRYAMLPDEVAPLWGIVVDPAHPQAHARYVTMRRVDGAVRDGFRCLLDGSCLQPR